MPLSQYHYPLHYINIKKSFDHVSNREFNSAMRTNINGLLIEGSSSYSQKKITHK